MNVNGSIMNRRQVLRSSCPERALGILTQPSHFRPDAGSSVGTEGITGVWAKPLRTNWGAQYIRELLKHRPCQECSRSVCFVSMGGTWGLIQFLEWVRHMVLKNSYFEVFLVAVALSETCFLISKTMEKYTTWETDHDFKGNWTLTFLCHDHDFCF